MATQELKCQVPLPGNPDRVVYVPPQPGQGIFDGAESLSSGIIVALVLGSLFGLGIIVWMVKRCCCSRDTKDNSCKEDEEDAFSVEDLPNQNGEFVSELT